MSDELGGCNCGPQSHPELSSPEIPYPIEQTTLSAIEPLVDLLSAFNGQTECGNEEPVMAVGHQLLEAGNAMLLMGDGLADVETDGLRSRDRLVDDLEMLFVELGDSLYTAGKEAVDCQASDAASLMSQSAELLTGISDVLGEGSFEIGASQIFPTYASVLGAPAEGLLAMGQALKSKSKNQAEKIAAANSLLAISTTSAAACLDAIYGSTGLYVNDARTVHLDPACVGCPHVGCTTYCNDRYVARIGCTSSGAFTVCRWNVVRTIKTVCCCYASGWDKFWAINCCKKQISLRTRRLIKRTTHLGDPPTAPFNVVTLC
ncbi:hypothetical protein ACFSJ3_03540 [Corallincola platygyrae]|uniref:Uncharacterized protein n=1 Tax=Corallincola platygyrae TaxID=1193278 RepID=A0ABW4XJ22_9GAMM